MTREPIALVRWLIIATVLVAGAYLRLTGLNWDDGHWIHPDEGHMRLVVSSIRVPDDLSLYFDTSTSPLNPRNNGQQYSYGTLPLFVTRALGEWLDRACGPAPDPLSAAVASTFVTFPEDGCVPGTFTGAFYSAIPGRLLSALADLGTLLLTYLLGRRLYGDAVGLLAATLAAFTAFMIQQAHFFTVDSTACFFVVLTAYFSVRAGQSPLDGGPSWAHFGLAGVATGLATASKVSAALAAGLVALAGLWWWLRYTERESRSILRGLRSVVPRLALAAFLSLLAFRIAQPYAFEGPGIFGVQPSVEWFERLGQIRAEQSGMVDLPSGRQWTNRAPIVFPWVNLVVWGMGIPLGLTVWAGWVVTGWELLRGKRRHLVLWTWVTIVFVFQATRWVKAMRYFLPLYPLLTILGAYALVRLYHASSHRRRYAAAGLTALVVVGTVVWGLTVFSIYLRPHTRIAASRWIYDTVPAGATIANEHWDWGLPLRLDGHDPFSGTYTGIEMQNYDEDTPEKRERLYAWLEQADYIVLASNRLYASIARLPARYPLTTEYYRALFAGELGFDLAADFTSYPAVGPIRFPDQETPFPLMKADYLHQPGTTVVLPPAEESFSVYDHPRVLIFRKTPEYSRQRVEAVLGDVDLHSAQVGRTPREATNDLYLLAHDTRRYLGIGLICVAGVLVYRRLGL